MPYKKLPGTLVSFGIRNGLEPALYESLLAPIEVLV
jgi:hypothetical protein